MVRACDGTATCKATPRVGAACSDNNPCTYGETCSTDGACAGGTTVVCQDDVCVKRTCNGTPTCAVTPKTGSGCDDNNPCTYGETCGATGQCGGGVPISCQDDACNTRTCNGTPTCAATPKTGATCTDGDPCTYGETCSAQGICLAGAEVKCENDACNYRTCNGTPTCKVTPRPGRHCEDGNLCTYADTCNAEGACVGTALVCTSDETAERSCNGSSTCTVVPKPGASCDDGNPCTQGDVRGEDGICRGMAYECPVTACLVSSACDGQGGCVSVAKPDGTGCDADASRCTPNDICRAGVCVPDPQPVTCIERDCNTVQCRPDTGDCEYQPTSGGECGRSGCFSQGVCNAGVCSGMPKDCSALDGACQVGVCDAATGACVGAPKINGTACSAGGLCSVTAVCAFGNCELEPMACPAASSACKIAACDPGTGQCIEDERLSSSPCDPGNSCIRQATCDEAGMCLGSPAPNGEPCTTAAGAIGQCLAATCVALEGTSFVDAGAGGPGVGAGDGGPGGDGGGGCSCRLGGGNRPGPGWPSVLVLLAVGLLRARRRSFLRRTPAPER